MNNFHNYNTQNPNSNNKFSQRVFYNKEDPLNNTIIREKAQKIVSITEMGSNTNSVRRIYQNNKDANFSVNAKNSSYLDKRSQENNNQNEKNLNSENNSGNNRSHTNVNRYTIEDNDNFLEYEREKRNILEGKIFHETEDWTDLLKQSNMTREEFNFYSKNRGLSKIIELIENLNKLLRDKNFQIKILLEENKNLNIKNEDLNKENMTLNTQNMHLLKENIKYNNDYYRNTKGDTGMDSSMVKNSNL